jgi:nucleoside-diphosphate-sugar epimerase
VQIISYEEAYKDPGYEDFMRRVPSIDKIGQAVGWEPTTSLNETIDQIIDYYRENT